jgi:hypothetical protein
VLWILSSVSETVNERPEWLIITMHNVHKYPMTQADDYSPDNLLSLPECPK